MITNLIASIVVTLFTNVHEHQWTPMLKTRVCEVSQRSTWTFPNHVLPDAVAEEKSLSQTTILFEFQNGQWVESSNGRTSGIFVTNGSGWMFYVPYPGACPHQMPCPPGTR